MLNRQYIAEFLGTFWLVFIACGAMVYSELFFNFSGMTISIIWGLSVTTAILMVGKISGAHINPAVTVALWNMGEFDGRKVFGYLTSQTMGAISASYLHFLLVGSEHTFGATILRVDSQFGFLVEVIISFALMFSILVSSKILPKAAPYTIGATVGILAYVAGGFTGASMNPARSIGPMLMNGNISDLWIYLVAPVSGMICACLLFELIVGLKNKLSEV
jgi:MIP family channel proteins